MIKLPPSSGKLYLYLDEAGEFEDINLADDMAGSLVAGILCPFAPQDSEPLAVQIREDVRQKYLSRLKEDCDFRHAKVLPPDIKAPVKVDVVERIIQAQHDGFACFIPVVFRQKGHHFIQDSTTTYVLYLVDGLVKLIQDIDLQQKYDLVITIGGRRDIAWEAAHPGGGIRYIALNDIRHQFEKYLTLQKIRTPYLFQNMGQITFRQDDDHINDFLILSDYISNTFLTHSSFHNELEQRYAKLLPKHHLYSIREDPSAERVKRYLAEGNAGLALFYLMSIKDDAPDEYSVLVESCKAVLGRMSASEMQFTLNSFYQYIKRLLTVQRDSDLTVQIANGAIELLCGGNGILLGSEFYAGFMANMNLFKMTGKTHLGAVKSHSNIAAKTISYVKQSADFELYLIYITRQVVHLSDIFLYESSLSTGARHEELLSDMYVRFAEFNEHNKSEFYPYREQYARLCGALTLTAYFTLCRSEQYLAQARTYSDKALGNFRYAHDKERQWQLRAHIEAEAGDFEAACRALLDGIGIDIRSAESTDQEKWDSLGAFGWYHLSKLLARIMLPDYSPTKQDIARKAIKVVKPYFMAYRNKLKAKDSQTIRLRHPDFISWYMMGMCMGEIGEIDLGLQLIDEAYNGAKTEVDGKIAINAITAANALVILAHKLLFCALYERATVFDRTRELLQQELQYYLNSSVFKQMQEPFDSWEETISDLSMDSPETVKICRDLSRTILF